MARLRDDDDEMFSTLQSVRQTVETHVGVLPVHDAQRIVHMAVMAGQADVAMACSNKGMYYNWHEALPRLTRRLAQVQDDFMSGDAAPWDIENARDLVRHAQQPGRRMKDLGMLQQQYETEALTFEMSKAMPSKAPTRSLG